MKGQLSASSRGLVKFKMPTAQNLVPIRLDLDIDGQRFKDCFTWNPSDPDSEIVVFAKRIAKDLKLLPSFITVIASAIQGFSKFWMKTWPHHNRATSNLKSIFFLILVVFSLCHLIGVALLGSLFRQCVINANGISALFLSYCSNCCI